MINAHQEVPRQKDCPFFVARAREWLNAIIKLVIIRHTVKNVHQRQPGQRREIIRFISLWTQVVVAAMLLLCGPGEQEEWRRSSRAPGQHMATMQSMAWTAQADNEEA